MRLPTRNLKAEVHLKTPLGLPTRPFSLFSWTTSVEWSIHQSPAGPAGYPECSVRDAQPQSTRLHECPRKVFRLGRPAGHDPTISRGRLGLGIWWAHMAVSRF